MQFVRGAFDPLQHMYWALLLGLLLVGGQQGALVHELGHVADARNASSHAVVSAASPGGGCMLCPLYVQVTAAAFSHAMPVAFRLRAGIARMHAPVAESVGGPIPTPRSRGPPSLS